MNQEYYISLIIQQFSEELNEAQNAELTTWLSQSEANKSVKDKLIESWNKAGSYKNDIEVDESDAWNTISSRLSPETIITELNPISKSIPLWRKPLIAAASLAIVLACSWLFLFPDNNQSIRYATNTNETLEITLPDGSLVNLNEDSQLTYSGTKNHRNITLSGEAFFEVSHDKSHPFIVESHNTKTTVLGTRFNIKAYDKEEVALSLFEGKVSFKIANHNAVELAPGEMVNYLNAGNEIVKSAMSNKNAIAWKTKELKFQNDNLVDVVNAIEVYFEKNIELNLYGESCSFTGSFKNPDYNEIIEVLKYTFDMNYKQGVIKDKISIKGCR